MAACRETVVDTFRIPDALWERMEPLLPKVRRSRKGGRPPLPRRQVLDGIFYVLRTGCHWKAAPPEFGSGSSLHRYFQRWTKRGLFRKLWQNALREYDDKIGIDWEWQSLDGTMTKAPLGGEKDGQKPHGSGQNGHEAFGADGRPGCAAGPGGGRGQPARHGTGRSHPGQHPGRTPGADAGEAAALLGGQGVRLPLGAGVGEPLGLHGPHPGQEGPGGQGRTPTEGPGVSGPALGGGADA
jgi:transposase